MFFDKYSNFIIFIITISLLNNLIKSQPESEIESQTLFSELHNSKYLWGTYKPNLYFSMKQKQKETPVFGLMWYGIKENYFSSKVDIDNILRHECAKTDLIKYYWPYHNGLDYSNEIIKDEENNIFFDIQNIKTNYDINEQSWISIIKGKTLKNKNSNNNIKKNIGIILYFSLEEFSMDKKAIFNAENIKINNENYELKEMRFGKEIEKFNIEITQGKEGIKYSEYQKYRKGYQYNWRVKYFITESLKVNQEIYAKKNITYSFIPFDEMQKTKQPNIIAIQIVFSMDKIINDNFEIIVRYSNNLKKEKESKEEINNIINKKREEFNQKFESIFSLKNIEAIKNDKNFNLNEKHNESLQQMSKEALSNLLGGIGYFHGSIKQKQKNNSKENIQQEKSLFTATPCRSYFARGFLWDEGFHQIIISKWDLELSLEMVNTWLDTMDNQGWIPREQIRGIEAEAQVPEEFREQDFFVANPPTLLFPIKTFINIYRYYKNSKITNNNFGMKELLVKFYNKLKLWMNWFEITQKNKNGNKNNIYAWNKRNSEHNYPSGFDDLPRGMTPNDEENHLDLNIWLLELEKTLLQLSQFFDKESIDIYNKNILERKKDIKKNLFSDELNIYSDYLGPQFKKIKVKKYPRKVFPYLWRNDNQCGEKVLNPIGTRAECNPYGDSPCCSEFGWCGNTKNHCECPKCIKSYKLEERKEYKKKENTFNPHIGYINLFPIFFGDFNETELGDLFKYLGDKNEFLSDYGIRSLVKSDLLYRTGDDYWRGKIWIQINYLVLRGLNNYFINNKEIKNIYDKIRYGLIKAVYKTWAKSHTFFENYDDITGEGVMNHPFNGWTSTILLILSENYE